MKKMVVVLLFCIFTIGLNAQQGSEWNVYTLSVDVKNSLFINGDRFYLNINLGINSLFSFSREELRILRNYIYAKYNYSFSSPDLIEYFSKFSWYRATESNVDNRLNDIDRENIKLIQELENNYPTNNDAERITGVWRLRGAVPDQGYTWGDYIIMYPNGTYQQILRNFNATRVGNNTISGGSIYGIWTTGRTTSSSINLITITNMNRLNNNIDEARINNDLWWLVSNNPLNYRFDWGSM
jgi:hypothetical protein